MLRISILCLLLGSLVANIQAQCTTQNVRESVINGDFEQGYVPGQFTTDEIYLYDPSNSAMSTLVDAIKAGGTGGCAWTSATHFEIDQYFGPFNCSGIGYDGHPFISEGNGRYDHTQGIGGTGKYMMIDGQLGAPTGLGWKLWEQTIPVYANEMYYFTAWFINLTPLSTGGDRVDIRFVVTPLDAGGVPLTPPAQLGAAFSPAETSRGNNWEQAFQTYTPPIGTVTVRLGIYNQAGATNGNDVGIDDISFQNGCSNILSLSIPPAPDLPATINICESASTTITLNSNVATNAGAGRTFSWYSGVGATQAQIGATNTTANTINISAPGTYRVCVYQAGGCAKSSTVVVVPTVAATGNDINVCTSGALAATITPSAVAPFLTYSWQKNAGAWGGSVNNVNATADGPGTFTLTGVHSNGLAACNVTKSFTVTAGTASFTNNTGPGPYALCSPASQTLTASLTGTGYTYQWYNGGAAIGGATGVSYTATTAGTYRVVVSLPTSGCADVTSNTVTITNSNAITGVGATFCPNAAVSLSVTPAVASAYRWYDTDGVTIVQAASPTSSSYTTPILSASHTYYVEDVRASSTTLTTTNGGAINWGTPYVYTFDLTNPLVIKTVTMMRGGWGGAGSTAIEIVNNSGTVVATSATTAVTDGAAAAPFVFTFGGGAGVTIATGTGYRMRFNPTNSIGYNGQTNISGGGVTNTSTSLNGGGGGGNVFGNWTVDVPTNTCARVPVVATAFCALPVTLVSFHGFQSNGLNQLSWTTANEINTSVFVVQRSIDGVHFTDVASQPAAGNSSTILNYSYAEPAYSSTTYYRLRQVDIDGAYNYTSVVSIDGSSSSLGTLLTNPASTVVQVQLTGSADATVQVSILNIHGVLVYQGSYNGNELVTINTALTPGVYIVRLEGISSAESHKLIAQ